MLHNLQDYKLPQLPYHPHHLHHHLLNSSYYYSSTSPITISSPSLLPLSSMAKQEASYQLSITNTSIPMSMSSMAYHLLHLLTYYSPHLTLIPHHHSHQPQNHTNYPSHPFHAHPTPTSLLPGITTYSKNPVYYLPPISITTSTTNATTTYYYPPLHLRHLILLLHH